MRRIALINQKGGVGKTTTVANLGAALALAGKRVVVVDLDPQANLTLYLGVELEPGEPSSYRVLTREVEFGAALRATATPNLKLLPTDIDLSGAEMELSEVAQREKLLRTALEDWCSEHRKKHGTEPADYVLFDCPPSLGLLSLNALAASDEVFVVVQTQFLALQGMSKLVEVIELVKKELHPGLKLGGIVPCMYDSRMRLAREVLTELRRYFPDKVFRTPITSNVKLAESPSFGKTIFEYAPDSIGARDFASLAHEVMTQEVLAQPAEPEVPRRATRPSLAAVVQRVAASLEPVRPPAPPAPAAVPVVSSPRPVVPPAKPAPSAPAAARAAEKPKASPPIAEVVPAARPAPAKAEPKSSPRPRKAAAPAAAPVAPAPVAQAPTRAPLAPVPSVTVPAAASRVAPAKAPAPAPTLPPAASTPTNGSAPAPASVRRPRSRATPSS